MVYRQFSSEERYQIAALRREGLMAPDIAAALGRHRSTIARELARNATPYDGAYRPNMAVEMTNGRLRRSRRNARYGVAEFAPIEVLLREDWSPAQIVGRSKLEGDEVMSHERRGQDESSFTTVSYIMLTSGRSATSLPRAFPSEKHRGGRVLDIRIRKGESCHARRR